MPHGLRFRVILGLGTFGGAAACWLVLLLACTIGIIAAPLLSLGYAGGLAGQDPEHFALVVQLTRWLFPFLALAALSALATGVLNVFGSFTLPAFSPALFNLGMIAAPFALVPLCTQLGFAPIMGLAFGALLGGLLQVIVLAPSLARVDRTLGAVTGVIDDLTSVDCRLD